MLTPNFASLDGEKFEDLCEDLFKAMGLNDPPPERSGRGPDGGRDMIVTEYRESEIRGFTRPFRWLVECKNFAESNKSVQPQDVGCILDKLSRHQADGYLLITSTIPSTNLEATISGINQDPRFPFEATFWARPKLIDEIHKHRNVYEKYFGVPGPDAARPIHWSQRNPFMELFAYDEVHAGYFFGREADIRSISEKIYRYNVVLLYGESGVGKTSLVNAGLLPILQKEGVIVTNLTVRPGFASVDILKALQSIIPSPQLQVSSGEAKSFIVETFQDVAKWLRGNEQRLVVILDQVEAIFLGTTETRAELGYSLATAVSEAKRFGSVTFLFSLRSDYLESLGIWAKDYQIPDLWINAYPLNKLSEAETTEILNKVPNIVGAEFTEEVISLLVTDLKNLDKGRVYPPNLQIVANKVFETARRRTDQTVEKLLIRLEDYEALGGTKGIIETFLDDKLSNFGSDKDFVHKILLALVSATGRRLALSEDALTKHLSVDEELLKPILTKLSEVRLIKPTDEPQVYELVHDVLAVRVLEATEDEQRKAKAAKEAFELSLTAWQTENILESSEKIYWFYKYREFLNIGPDELVFLLLSNTRADINDIYESVFGERSIGSPKTYFKPSWTNPEPDWVDAVNPIVCITALDQILNLSQEKRIAKGRTSQIISNLCSASNLEVQQALLLKLESLQKHPFYDLFLHAYIRSYIPTQATLSFLQDVAISDYPLEIKWKVVLRLLEYYRYKFSKLQFGPRNSIETRNQGWLNEFPSHLLSNEIFRDITFEYLGDKTTDRARNSIQVGFNAEDEIRYRTELLKILHNYDPNRTVQFLWTIAHLDRYIGGKDQILELLRVYDPEQTLKEVIPALSKEDHYLNAETISFLERFDAPDADKLLIKNIEIYVNKFMGGSKRWTGKSIPYWRRILKVTVQAAVRRQLTAVTPCLAKIALNYEPTNLKLECIDAMVTLGGEIVLPTLLKLLNDSPKAVRDKCIKYLIDMKEHRDLIVKEIIKSFNDRPDDSYSFHKAERKDVTTTKISILGRLKDPQAAEFLDNLARTSVSEDIKRLASEHATALHKVQKDTVGN